jgi:hypothetical protein
VKIQTKKAGDVKVGDTVIIQNRSHVVTGLEPNFADAVKLLFADGWISYRKTTEVRCFPAGSCGCGRCPKCVASQARAESKAHD